MLAISIVPISTGVLRQYADTMPSGTPTTVANVSAASASSTVTGIRSAIRSTTVRPKRIEVPRSPVMTRPT